MNIIFSLFLSSVNYTFKHFLHAFYSQNIYSIKEQLQSIKADRHAPGIVCCRYGHRVCPVFQSLKLLAVTCTVPEQYLDYVTALAYEHKEVSR